MNECEVVVIIIIIIIGDWERPNLFSDGNNSLRVVTPSRVEQDDITYLHKFPLNIINNCHKYLLTHSQTHISVDPSCYNQPRYKRVNINIKFYYLINYITIHISSMPSFTYWLGSPRPVLFDPDKIKGLRPSSALYELHCLDHSFSFILEIIGWALTWAIHFHQNF